MMEKEATERYNMAALALAKHHGFIPSDKQYGPEDMDGLVGVLANHVQLAERAAKPAWIPVNEKKPEPGAYVLVYDKTEILIAEYDPDDKMNPPDFSGWWWAAQALELNPTHWMPLPKPPEIQES